MRAITIRSDVEGCGEAVEATRIQAAIQAEYDGEKIGGPPQGAQIANRSR